MAFRDWGPPVAIIPTTLIIDLYPISFGDWSYSLWIVGATKFRQQQKIHAPNGQGDSHQNWQKNRWRLGCLGVTLSQWIDRINAKSVFNPGDSFKICSVRSRGQRGVFCKTKPKTGLPPPFRDLPDLATPCRTDRNWHSDQINCSGLIINHVQSY